MKAATIANGMGLAVALALLCELVGPASVAWSQVRPSSTYRPYSPRSGYCPPGYRPPSEAPGRYGADGELLPPADGEVDPSLEGSLSQPDPSQAYLTTLASAYSGPAEMKGDTVGGGCGTVRFEGVVVAEVNHPYFGCSRQKIAENNSPLPRSRVYVNYQHFHNAILNTITDDDVTPAVTSTRDTHVDRFLFGIERTFWDDVVSVQVQVPYAQQLNDEMFLDFVTPSAPGDTQGMLGNVSVALKAILHRACCDRFLVSGGVLVEFPTASDVDLRAVDITDSEVAPGVFEPRELDFRLLYHNDSLIVSPFLAAFYMPNERYFLQGFTQVDTDVNGSDLDFNPTVTSSGVPIATTNSSFHFSGQTFLRLDAGAGVWLYRNRCAPRISGVAMLVELHYSTTLDDADIYQIPTPGIANGTIDFGNVANRLDIVNLTFGPTFEVRNRGTVGLGAVVPLSDGDNKPFDFEVQAQVNLRI
jgi:hypothetical protein